VQHLTTADFLLRLATGVSCGALIGVERQWRARMAGLRTNALVAAGATLFVLMGCVSASWRTRFDRIAQQGCDCPIGRGRKGIDGRQYG
jgi:uncharacterized membrane protein YhiD involved in acid resistance